MASMRLKKHCGKNYNPRAKNFDKFISQHIFCKTC